MEESLFRQMSGTYRQVGDYMLPDLQLPEEGTIDIGVWGQRRRLYLREHRRATYYTLLTNGKLNEHLAEIDRQSEEMFLRLVEQHASSERVTETLKAETPMEWVRRMNNIRSKVSEVVNADIIYT